MLLTYSKGGVVAVLIALYLNYFIKKDFVRLISSVALFAFFVFAIKDILFEALSGFELFRVDMGLNLRDIYAVIALEGIGESPIFGNGVSAIKDAIASVGNYKIMPNLNAPATPEAILLSINDIKKKL